MTVRSDDSIEGMVEGLGSLTLGEDYLEISTYSQAKYKFCREMIEEYFGHMVKFQTEEIIDHAKIMKERMEKGEMY